MEDKCNFCCKKLSGVSKYIFRQCGYGQYPSKGADAEGSLSPAIRFWYLSLCSRCFSADFISFMGTLGF